MTYKGIILPEKLNAIAESFIRQVIDELEAAQKLLVTDGAALYALARSYSRYLDAEYELEMDGVFEVTSKGKIISPYVKLSRDALSDVVDLCKQFGLTLASRGKIKETAQNIESPLSAFMRKRMDK